MPQDVDNIVTSDIIKLACDIKKRITYMDSQGPHGRHYGRERKALVWMHNRIVKILGERDIEHTMYNIF